MSEPTMPKTLSYDERKAAEAAFAGRPFDPSWSASARAIYDGILTARGVPVPEPVTPASESAEAAPPGAAQASAEQTTEASAPAGPADTPPAPKLLSREDALKAGALIDVTPLAHRMGLKIPISFSRPLWELGITGARNVPEADFEGRVRDVLLAFRLRLAGTPTASPLIEFPALLSFPPDPVPQTCLLFAVAQPDAEGAVALTMLLPGEVSTNILPPGKDTD
jgi:hypothetical protein